MKIELKQQSSLENISKLITYILEYSMIQDQINAMRETQKMMAEPYEVSQS